MFATISNFLFGCFGKEPIRPFFFLNIYIYFFPLANIHSYIPPLNMSAYPFILSFPLSIFFVFLLVPFLMGNAKKGEDER